MRIIMFQGWTCLGKTTLGRRFEKDLSGCRLMSVDKYIEELYDSHGFCSKAEREALHEEGRRRFVLDLKACISGGSCQHLIVEYPFKVGFIEDVQAVLCNCDCRTVLFMPANLKEHEDCWLARNNNLGDRHPGHGALYYKDGIRGEIEDRLYKDKLITDLRTIGEVLNVEVRFQPYSLMPGYNAIKDFVLR